MQRNSVIAQVNTFKAASLGSTHNTLHARAHIQIHTLHTQMHKHTHAEPPPTHPPPPTRHTHTHAHTYTHTHTHTHTHKHIHTYTHSSNRHTFLLAAGLGIQRSCAQREGGGVADPIRTPAITYKLLFVYGKLPRQSTFRCPP